MREWFGFTPMYLITLDASYCKTVSDREFCALVDNKLSVTAGTWVNTKPVMVVTAGHSLVDPGVL